MTAALYGTYVDPPAYIPSSKIPAISAAVLAACDALDGVSDGIINDPRQCHFDPAALLCHGADAESCLTRAQVAQLRKLYSGLRDRKGKQLYPGYPPGGEEGDYGWEYWITGNAPGKGLISIFGRNYFRDMVFENPAFNFQRVSPEKAVQIADMKTARSLNATDPDLRRFKAHGGKLILYHGWSDAGMTGFATTDYYESVVANMGLADTQRFFRLYMAPGMHHYALGPGPNFFGQVDLTALGGRPGVPVPMDPQHNISVALEQWVEQGIPPNAIIATKYVNDLDPSQGVRMTRPLCPYPQTAKYEGTGDTNDSASFVCTQAKD
jgi:feruloyl esterase